MLKKTITPRMFSALFVLVSMLVVIVPANAHETIPAKAVESPALQQYIAGGHVLGFAPNKVYLAGLDHALAVEFVGGTGQAPVGVAASAAAKTGVAPTLGHVTYKDAWPKVDVRYIPNASGIAESTYILQPGANVNDIRLKYNTPVQLLKDGSLKFAFESGTMNKSAPSAFQEMNGQRIPVDVRYTQNDQQISFKVGAYNPNLPLTITPTYTWHTFYDFQDDYGGQSITTDGSGNVYIAGSSNATWKGPNASSPLHAYTSSSNSSNIVVVKLNSAGIYQWHTFYGSDSIARAMVSDAAGNIYLTGYSHATWDGPDATPPLNPYGSGTNIFLLKLNGAGMYQWHTFYGSSDLNMGNAITLDGNGNLYVTGSSNTTWSGPGAKAPLHVHAFTGFADIVVIKLNTSGVYQWHTFYGATLPDEGYASTSDASGNIYVAGLSNDTWNGPSATAPLHSHSNGGGDIIVLKLNSVGAYQWHTFYGSSADFSTGSAITHDANGNIYVTGYSNGTWNGPGAIAPLHIFTGIQNIVAIKLNGAGAYQWHTFYGASSDWNRATAITSNGNGNIYITGSNNAPWNGPNAALPLQAYSGADDIVAIELNAAGAYQSHAFYGSSNYDIGNAITNDLNGNIYITGSSYGTWNGPAGNRPLYGNVGAVVIKLSNSSPAVTVNKATNQFDPTNTTSINFTATFSQPINISTFTNTDVTLGGTAAGTRSAVISQVAPNNGTKFNIAVSGITGSGTVTASLGAAKVTNLAGNPNIASTSSDNSITYDNTHPTVTINQAATQIDPTNTAPINFTVTFSEPINVSSFTSADITLGGTVVGIPSVSQIAPNNGTKFNVAVSGMTGSGKVTASLGAAKVTDLAANPNTASTSSDNSVTYDVTAPTVAINQMVGQSDPTSASIVNFTAVFSKPINVSSFTNTDVTLGGTAMGPLSATISQVAPNNGTTFKIAVSGMSASGTVTASLASATVTDLLGNANAASTSFDNQITYGVVCSSLPPLVSGQDQSGALLASGNQNPYKFEVTSPYTTIVANLTPPANGDFALNLFEACEEAPANPTWASNQAAHIGRRYIHIGPDDASKTEVRFNIGNAVGTYYLVVEIPNGGVYSSSSYQLHLELTPPIGLVDTLILYNPSRFKQKYGLDVESQMMDKLTQLAQHSKVNGIILKLDQFPDVVSAYNNWDAKLVVNNNENSYILNVAAANEVSKAIRAAMLAFLDENNNLVTDYVVLVGDDNQIPFRRLNINPDPIIPDLNWITERKYLSTLGDTPNTPTDAALMANQTLSDDFYGDYTDRPWAGNWPSLAVGRLLDTPTRIENTINAFIDKNGIIDLSSSGTASMAGYDFLADSAQAACKRLADTGLTSTDCTLIDTPATPNKFTADMLTQKLITSAPNIAGYYGHTNHGQIFTPTGNPLTAQQISAASFNSLTSSLWWVIGCQSGLVLPNSEKQALSLTQALGDHGVTYIGNTGWAWGSDGPAAYSEMLYQLLANQLTQGGPAAIGESLRLAKRDYFYKTINNVNAKGQNYSVSYYDAKVMSQATLYGLPMLKFVFPHAVSAQANSISQKVVTQLGVVGPITVGIDLSGWTQVENKYGSNTYYTQQGQWGYGVAPKSPLLPQSEYINFDTSVSPVAKGVIWRGGSYSIRPNNPLVLNPTQLNGILGVEPAFSGTYPLLPVALVSLSESKSNTIFTNRLTFQTGQYIGNANSGTLRLFNTMRYLVGMKNNINDNIPPTIGNLTTSMNGNSLRVQLPASDSSGIHKVLATYTFVNNQASVGSWNSTELTGTCAAGQQTYNLDIPLTTTGELNYFIQVMDCAGNVSVKLDSGQYYKVYLLNSAAAQDGWMLESSENSNVGGIINNIATTFNLGDDAANKQYRSMLHFNTSILPDNAVITSTMLAIQKQGGTVTNPFNTHGALLIDIGKPFFGTTVGLDVNDFQAVASKSAAATFKTTPVGNWYTATFGSTTYPFINLVGTTQFRLYFTKDDNNDLIANYLSFLSGNVAVATSRPILVIQYHLP